MVEDILRTKIRSLIRCLDRVRQKLPQSAEALAADLDAQDIVVINLQRAVQQAVDIAAHVIADRGLPAPADMAQGFVRLHEKGWISAGTAEALKRATGFRNVSVHEYQKMDWTKVYRIGAEHLDDFRKFVEELKSSGVLQL